MPTNIVNMETNKSHKGLNLFFESGLESDSNSELFTYQTNSSIDDIPENKGLLPPLPDETTINPTTTNNSLQTTAGRSISGPIQEEDSSDLYEDSTSSMSRTDSERATATSFHRRTSSSRFSTSSIVTTPKTESQFDFETPIAENGRTTPSNITPIRTFSKIEDPSISTICSPTITIDEKFDVSVEIPLELQSPGSIIEQIKFYEKFQQRESEEFEKTLKNLKQGGWVSEKDLQSLEAKKQKHHRKWQSKIKEMRKLLRDEKSSENSGINQNHINNDLYYFNMGNKVEPHSGDRDLDGAVAEAKSPNLQTLEQQFSVFGFR